jgi:ABC-type transport system involved in multi-copper enzyme maturation permease subunit
MNAEPVSMTKAVASVPVSKERVGFSLSRVWIIALNTFTEAVRQKVFNILLIFALVVIAAASFLAQFSFGEDVAQVASYDLKSIKDTCTGAISVVSMLIAIVGTAMLLPNEVENRTIYTILSKPVRRFEFLLGKYFGSVILVFVSLVLMSALFGAVLTFKEHRLRSEVLAEAQGSSGPEAKAETSRTLTQIRHEAYDPDLIKGMLLTFVKVSLLAAMTLLVSTFSTSMVFNVSVGVIIWIIGNLVGTAKELLEAHRVVVSLLAAIPDLGVFDVFDEINLGNTVPWAHVTVVTSYGLLRIALFLVAAHLIFSKREI